MEIFPKTWDAERDIPVRTMPDPAAPVIGVIRRGMSFTAYRVIADEPWPESDPYVLVGCVLPQDLPNDIDQDYQVVQRIPIREAPDGDSPVALKGKASLKAGEVFIGRPVNDGDWIWVTNGIGFVPLSSVVRRDYALPLDSPILAERVVPFIEHYVAFVMNRGVREYSLADVRFILGTYLDTAQAVGVDPLIAISQMILETDNLKSWWSQRPRRNPAGIGVTGEKRHTVPPEDERDQWAQTERGWERGLSFPTWEHAVRTNVGRLLAYALRDEETNESQQALIEEALSRRSLAENYRGQAKTLKGLNGTWAPVPDYADRIVRVANALLDWNN